MGHTCVHDESSRVRAREEFCGRALATPLTRSQRRQRCRRRKRRRLEMHHPGGALFQTGLCGRPCRQIRSSPLRRRNRCRPNLCRSGCLPRLVLSRFQNPPELMGYLGLVRAEFDWQQGQVRRHHQSRQWRARRILVVGALALSISAAREPREAISGPPTEAAFGMTRARGGAERSRTAPPH